MLKPVLLKQLQQRISGLPLHVKLWDGTQAGNADTAAIHIRLNSPAALTAFFKPTLGSLARAYVEGEMDLDGSPREILSLGSSLCGAEFCRDKKGSDFWKWWRHTRSGDRKNIQYHYDVSNDFYGLWLDARKVYSCAYYREPDMSLEAAQEAKLELICRKLSLKPGERFLDIGCGWGGLIFWAVEHYGVKALGVTLSDNQHAWVREQIKARDLQGRVEVRVMDYREMPEAGEFDKIASVGMVEHVGRKNLTTYFQRIHNLLKPGGLVLNHGITAAALRSKGLGSGISEFVDDYVFPGGELEHISELMQHATGGGLECLDAENLRPHYARTLWEWVRRLDNRAEEARKLIGERNYRIWRIYMAGSAHAFDQGWMELWQVLAGKPLAPGVQPNYPYQRDYIYR